jgi:hypothetical protein
MNAATVTSVVALCIAAFVALIGFYQWRVSRDKLRLDLFNRRFDIYLRVLDYYLSLSKPQTSPEQPKELEPFIKAVRESRFMFPPKSEVYQFLEELRTRANEVVNYTDSLKILEDMPREREELTRKQLENTGWMQKAMITLEDNMKPYVSFR